MVNLPAKVTGDSLTANEWNDFVNWAKSLQYVTGLDATGATDCRTELQAIIDNAPSGSTIRLPAGQFLISAELVVNKPLKIVGSGGRINVVTGPSSALWGGGSLRANTTIITSSATANGIKVTAPGVVLEDFAVVNTRSFASAPTAGTGILFDGSNQYAMSRVTVHGFYDCVKTSGFIWTFDSCVFMSPVRYGIFISSTGGPLSGDSGDCGISNCYVATARVATAAVRWEAGGGVRWVNNKINYAASPGKWEYGIDIAVAEGVSTGEMTFIGGAIGWCTKAGIRISRLETTGSLSNVIVTGMVFQGIGSAAADSVAIEIGKDALSTLVKEIAISNCTFHQWFGGGIVVNRVMGLTIGHNIWRAEQSAGGPSLTTPLITLMGNLWLANVERQNFSQNFPTQTVTIIDDLRTLGTNRILDGFTDHRYNRNVAQVAPADSDVWVTQFTIEPPSQGGAGIIDVQFSGQEQASSVPGYQNQYFTRRISRSFVKNNTTVGGAITVATVGTDATAGTTNYFDMRVVDAGSGKLAVQTKLLPDGSQVRGEIECNATGRIRKYSFGVGV